jgi:Na+/alanine symporter
VDVFAQFISSVNSFVWGPWMLVFLVGTGIFLTVRLGFWQFQIYKNKKVNILSLMLYAIIILYFSS